MSSIMNNRPDIEGALKLSEKATEEPWVWDRISGTGSLGWLSSTATPDYKPIFSYTVADDGFRFDNHFDAVFISSSRKYLPDISRYALKLEDENIGYARAYDASEKTIIEMDARIVELGTRVKELEEGLEEIACNAEQAQNQYDRNGPQWTSNETGEEYYSASAYLDSHNEIVDRVRALLYKTKSETSEGEKK